MIFYLTSAGPDILVVAFSAVAHDAAYVVGG
jgi:hypothetical protein